jgi:hypothetical protein
MIKFKKTLKELKGVGQMLKVGLQKELIAQKHNATGRLSRGLKYHIKGNVLNIYSSVSYWKAVNNPKFAKKTNIETIKKWVSQKGLPQSAAYPIYQKLTNNKNTNRRGYYGKPYAYWTEGNNLRRTNFAGYVANKFSKEVAIKLAPSIGEDVASMIREKIKNNTKAKVS